MTKKQTQAARDELDMKLAIAEQDARHAAAQAALRAESDRLVADEKQQMALERLEAQAQAIERAAVTSQQTTSNGFWADAVQTQPVEQGQVPAQADVADMTLEQYAASRSALGIEGRGIERLGRAPGRERAEYRGHRLEDGSWFPDWRDMSSGNRVFRTQLPDQRRPVPPGYQRQQSGELDEHYH